MQLWLTTPLAPADQSNLQTHLIPFVKHAKYYPNSVVAALMENKKMSLLMTPPQILIKLVDCWILCFMTFADSTDVASGHHIISIGHIYLFISVEQWTINLFLLEEISKERERFTPWIDLIWIKWLMTCKKRT